MAGGTKRLAAQSELTESSQTSDDRFGHPVETVWEFGLLVTSTGNAEGISATVPIPMDWPEQSLLETKTDKSDNIRSLKISDPTDSSRQLVFSIDRLTAGQSARAVMRFKIKKQMTLPPTNPQDLQFVQPVPSKLKTFLKPSPQIESGHKKIKQIANELQDSSLTAWNQIENNYQWVREHVQYSFDTEIHSCLEALESGQGDCEELSSLFIAICRAQGIPARAVWIPGHTYPEFYLVDQTGIGHWFPCQAAGDYQFGSISETRPILQKGDRFRLPGKSGFVRYLQPTLVARNASGELQLEWISREIPGSATNPAP